ncbi:Uncharacterized protein HZ326_15224 [Fusarium oxysporum f. sp. albedinis]|nr:Uncharacterized protein HZ326_15224 [Fusarium oxysporum f. sp. albedinis]
MADLRKHYIFWHFSAENQQYTCRWLQSSISSPILIIMSLSPQLKSPFSRHQLLQPSGKILVLVSLAYIKRHLKTKTWSSFTSRRTYSRMSDCWCLVMFPIASPSFSNRDQLSKARQLSG